MRSGFRSSLDSFPSYFDEIRRMSTRGYIPTDQDILRSRVKTSGITEISFFINPLTYKFFDVGGQRSERRKWIHCFDNLHAVIFLVALSEYDQVLREDSQVVRPRMVQLCAHNISCRVGWQNQSPCSTRSVILGGLPIRRWYDSFPYHFHTDA